jgi:hypothetical protein
MWRSLRNIIVDAEAVKVTKSKVGNYEKMKNIRKRIVKNQPEARRTQKESSIGHYILFKRVQ